jgi:putative endonuclease
MPFMWYVYFLRLANGDIYVGSTNDLRRRMGDHNHGRAKATRNHRPLTLASYVAVHTEQHARTLEDYFKSGSGKAVARTRLIREPPDQPPASP